MSGFRNGCASFLVAVGIGLWLGIAPQCKEMSANYAAKREAEAARPARLSVGDSKQRAEMEARRFIGQRIQEVPPIQYHRIEVKENEFSYGVLTEFTAAVGAEPVLKHKWLFSFQNGSYLLRWVTNPDTGQSIYGSM